MSDQIKAGLPPEDEKEKEDAAPPPGRASVPVWGWVLIACVSAPLLFSCCCGGAYWTYAIGIMQLSKLNQPRR